MDLGSNILKINVGIRISIFEILCMPTFRQNEYLEFFGPNSPKNGFWGRNFESLSVDAESAPPRYHMYQFSGKTENFDFFGPNSPKNGFWGRNFEKLNPDAELAPPRNHVCQFSGKMDNFDFFGPSLPKNGFCSWNFRNLSLESESAPPSYHMCQFSCKTTLTFSTQICPKKYFGVRISKVWIWNQHLQYAMTANFQAKWTTLNFSA